MPKAKSLDRIELTKKKFGFVTGLVTKEDLEKKKNSPFLMMVAEMKQENPELHNDYSCPMCGGELVRYEGCYRCKKCSWSKC